MRAVGCASVRKYRISSAKPTCSTMRVTGFAKTALMSFRLSRIFTSTYGIHPGCAGFEGLRTVRRTPKYGAVTLDVLTAHRAVFRAFRRVGAVLVHHSTSTLTSSSVSSATAGVSVFSAFLRGFGSGSAKTSSFTISLNARAIAASLFSCTLASA